VHIQVLAAPAVAEAASAFAKALLRTGWRMGKNALKTHASVSALLEFFRGHDAVLFPESFRGSRISCISWLKLLSLCNSSLWATFAAKVKIL
jgi:hypothetical protein